MLYPVAIEKGNEDSAFGAIFPDVAGCFSAGDSYEEALQNAHQALDLHFEALAEMGEVPPSAAALDDHFNKPEFEGFLWALVDIDIEPYLGGAVKKNVTLPKLLLKKIDDLVKENPIYKDRSHFLQMAASHEVDAINKHTRKCYL
ncbi:MAG: type II toxin-antitoxin system HicB family antitoxin [Vibrio sp.]